MRGRWIGAGGGGGGADRGEETKTWEKSMSWWDFKFVVSDVDKCISGRLTLDIMHQSAN